MKVSPGTLLVVEDDASLRSALATVVESLGCRVCTAADPDGACQILSAERVDAVLLDIGPGTSGLAAFLTMTYRWPHLTGRIALMTGNPDAGVIGPWLTRHPCTLFRKPFHFDQLATWLDDAVRDRSREAATG